MDGTQVRVNPAVSPTVVRSRPPDPCVIVIFGVTGDLTHRKLAPALYNLAREGDLPERYAIIGTSTSVGSADQFRSQLRESISKYSRSKPIDENVWSRFSGPIETVAADVNAPADYQKLRQRIE